MKAASRSYQAGLAGFVFFSALAACDGPEVRRAEADLVFEGARYAGSGLVLRRRGQLEVEADLHPADGSRRVYVRLARGRLDLRLRHRDVDVVVHTLAVRVEGPRQPQPGDVWVVRGRDLTLTLVFKERVMAPSPSPADPLPEDTGSNDSGCGSGPADGSDWGVDDDPDPLPDAPDEDDWDDDDYSGGCGGDPADDEADGSEYDADGSGCTGDPAEDEPPNENEINELESSEDEGCGDLEGDTVEARAALRRSFHRFWPIAVVVGFNRRLRRKTG